MEKTNLLSINQLARACGTSRATILRLEEKGLLEAEYIDADNGYRYYNSRSVFRLSRILTYQALGISQNELSEIGTADNSYHLILQSLEKKLHLMEEYVENLKVITGQYDHLSIVNFTIAEHFCYQKKLKNVDDPSKIRDALWVAFDEVISEGLSISRDMGPYISMNLFHAMENGLNPAKIDYTLRIPVVEAHKSNHIEFVPRTNTVSIYLRGDSRDYKTAFGVVNDYLSQRNMQMTGEARVIKIITSYPGEQIPAENWITRISVPIKD